MNKQLRIPRPLGITELSIAYNNTNDNDIHNSLQEKVIHHYIRNNFSYCGIFYNIEQFAFMLRIKESDIQKHLVSYGKELEKVSRDISQGDMLRVLREKMFLNCLEDRSAIQQQLTLMLQSQGNSYKPFISSEVGKTLKLLLDSNNAIAQILKGTGSQMPFIPDLPGTNPNSENGITVDQAVRLMKEENVTPLLQDNSAIKALEIEYGLSDMPEVNALLQEGMDVSNEALSLNTITDLDESLIIAPEESNKDKHRNRRAREIGKDLDADEI